MVIRIRRGACVALTLLACVFLGIVSSSAAARAERAGDQAAQTGDPTRLAIQGVMEAFHESGGFPGATLGYVTKDGLAGSVSVGMAFTETGTPMTADHRMMAGSTGKVLFASLFLQLVDEGELELDAPISTWLGDEEWFERLPNADDITFRMLMNHTSGIPRHVFNPDFLEALSDEPQRRWEPEEMFAYVFDQEALFPAGEGWSYADTNFVVAGLIAEKVTGESCYNQIYERIIRPHGLWDLVATTSPDVFGLAGGYVDPENNAFGFTEANVVQHGRFVINQQFEWAGGGYASTPTALAELAHLLYGGEILSERMLAEMRTTVPARLGRETRYGLGMMQRPSHPVPIVNPISPDSAGAAKAAFDGEMGDVIGHSGFFPGYLTEMAYYDEHGVALAMQVNTSQMSREMNPVVMSRVLDECARVLIGEGTSR